MGPRWLRGKESAWNAGAPRDVGLNPGSGRSPGEGHSNPLQYSCLRNAMDRGAWWAAVHRAGKRLIRLKQLSTQAHGCITGSRHWTPETQHCKSTMLQQKLEKKLYLRTSLRAWWLRVCAPSSEGLGSIPGGRTRSSMKPQRSKILSATPKKQCNQINKQYLKNYTSIKLKKWVIINYY